MPTNRLLQTICLPVRLSDYGPNDFKANRLLVIEKNYLCFYKDIACYIVLLLKLTFQVLFLCVLNLSEITTKHSVLCF